MSNWWEKAYPGGPMVGVGLKRSLYPPDASQTASADGDDIVALKRAISRGGRWPWGTFDRAFSNGFSHGKAGGNVKDSGLAGFQRQMKIQATGFLGEATWNAVRSARIPEGLPHAGEPLLDQTALDLYEGYKVPSGKSPRQIALDHLKARNGYTEQPANSNCDERHDGIRTAQDKTAGSGTWLRYEPWCGCWCFYGLDAAGVAKLDSSLCSVAQIEDNAKAKRICFKGWTTDKSKVKNGDLVIIGGYGVHVEMVRGFDGSNTLTYGGNTSPGSSGSQSNGGGAYARSRNPGEVRGYALVRYPGE
jgi:hypothetical protein